MPAKLFLVVIFVMISTHVSAKSEFSIMSYNVENLFDDQDDAERDDETYLPSHKKQSADHKKKCKQIKNFKYRKDCFQLDWNSKAILLKMENLAKVILSVENGLGPDILILNEVENINILKQFTHTYLLPSKYKTIELIEGEDKRGIDVAVLSRFSLTEKSHLHPLKLTSPENGRPIPTRGVLRVPLKLPDGKQIAIYAAHLPSQGASSDIRWQAIKSLNEILSADKLGWIVGGDFNISHKEEAELKMVSDHLAEQGTISHLIGCESCKGNSFL